MMKRRPVAMLALLVMALLIFGAVAWHMPAIEVSTNYANTGEPIIRELESGQVRGFFDGMYLACLVAIALLVGYVFKRTLVVSIISTVLLIHALRITILGFSLNYMNLVYQSDFPLSLLAAGVGSVLVMIAAIVGIARGSRGNGRVEQMQAEIDELKGALDDRGDGS